MAAARKNWAEVLRSAERGTTVEITRDGQPVAAVVSIELSRGIARARRENAADVVARFRASVDPRDLKGPDPWADVRDRSPGREVAWK